MNSANLIPNSERTPSELREQTRRGGLASGEARRERKRIREALEAMLDAEAVLDGDTLTGAQRLALGAFEAAYRGNVKALEFIRDTVGEKPPTEQSVNLHADSVPDEIRAEIIREHTKARFTELLDCFQPPEEP